MTIFGQYFILHLVDTHSYAITPNRALVIPCVYYLYQYTFRSPLKPVIHKLVVEILTLFFNIASVEQSLSVLHQLAFKMPEQTVSGGFASGPSGGVWLVETHDPDS